MKKIICALLSLVLLLGLLSACGGAPAADPTARVSEAGGEADPLRVVTTVFPEYDWVRALLGDRAGQYELTLLLDSGVDLHSYEPTASDIITVSNCDMFIYVGGESDDWVEAVLDQAQNKDMVVINLLEALGDKVKAEEIKEGMEAEHDHAHEEIEAEEIRDRTLAEFAGEWKSLFPMLQAGELDEYAAHEAEEDGSSVEEAKAELSEKWACDAAAIGITDSAITFTYADGKTVTADYTYAGYAPVLAEDGDIAGVRYQFETENADAPKYVQFSDHAHAPAEEVEHFHCYFGSESFDALSASEADPFFVPADADAEEVIEALTGGHGHHHEEGEEEKDEHVWLSLKNAAALCTYLAQKLGEIDPDHKADIDANAAAYIEELNALDGEYQAAVDAASVKTLLFGDRFPFRYLADDYGLDYYAAFSGCSAETEASFETVAFLAQKVDALGLKSILQIESADGSLAETIRDATETKDQTIYTMNSLQSTTAKNVEEGATYLAAMRENLSVLKEALN